jgi:hypothetical protein
MLFIKTTRFTQVLATQFLNGIPIYLGDLYFQVSGYKDLGTTILLLDSQLIRFTFSDSINLPVNNEQLVLINSSANNWRITNYDITDSDGLAFFRYAYTPPTTLSVLASASTFFEVGTIQLDI